ncbi:MAG TPA: SH3 domain-containing protein [Vicinamibacterales bacterium]|nr:SH3 domain-containing protein [Vicinamibacterales bacterium]
MIARTLSAIAVAALVAVGLAAQDDASVKVTVPRANIRSEANDRAPVVTQVPSGTLLQLMAVEGDWFKVRVSVGSIRIEAYISKKVSAIAKASGAPAPAAPASAPTPTPVTTVDGMSVAVDVNGSTTWVTPHAAKATHDAQTWTWIVEGSAADRVLDVRRPAFVVMFKDVPGVSPDDLAPALIRLTPSASGGRQVAIARGSADLASRTASDWDLSKDLKQDVVRSESQLLERGAVKIHPAGDLPAGQYAVVLRPSAGKKKLAGADVLSTSGAGRAFALAWDFAIK